MKDTALLIRWQLGALLVHWPSLSHSVFSLPIKLYPSLHVYVAIEPYVVAEYEVTPLAMKSGCPQSARRIPHNDTNIGPQDYKTCFMVTSAEHEIYLNLNCILATRLTGQSFTGRRTYTSSQFYIY